MSSLPKWLKEAKKESNNVFEIQLCQALEIAWEALVNINQRLHREGCRCAALVGPEECGCNSPDVQAKDALRRIEEMGK